MTELKTNFNTAPYYDDYSEDKDFYRILFKPRTAVQARELTQIQTILQNQVSRFGSHVFKDGTVVDGVNISYVPKMDFIHLVDTFNGSNLSSITDVANTFLLTNSTNSNTAVRAVAFLTRAGFRNAYPNTNRIYLKYIYTGRDTSNTDQYTFSSSDTIYIYNQNQNKFSTLDANNLVESIDMISSNATANAIGVAFGITVSDGIIYQKGHFLRVESQTIPVRNFDTRVNGYVVGFETKESLISANQDQSLNDQSAGFTNFNAPGADRLKLTPTLVAKRQLETGNTNFFAIAEFEGDQAVEQKENPVYNILGDELAKRTYEESGDYVVKPFVVNVEPSGNSQTFLYSVSPGIAYVGGHRVELIGTKRVEANRATTTEVLQNRIITTNYGNYVNVNELVGNPDYKNVEEITIYDAEQNACSDVEGLNPAPSGNAIGKANVLNLVYNSGVKGRPETSYKLYIFNIRMDSGKSFRNDAKSFASSNFKADIILESSQAVLQENNRRTLIFNTGSVGLKTFEPNSVNDTSYTYIQSSTATMNANGVATFTTNLPAPGGSEVLGFSVGSLSDANELDFHLSFGSNSYSANLTGGLILTANSTTVSGNNTTFTTELTSNSYIRIDIGGSFVNKRVVSIANNTSLEIDTAASVSNSDATFQQFFPAGHVINLAGSNTINILSSTQFTVDINTTLDSGSVTILGQYPVNRTVAKPTKKLVRKNRLVKIDCSNNAAGVIGPWNLGLPDVFKLKNVYVGTTYANTNPNRVTWFNLDNGQKDTHYDHAQLIIKPQYKNLVANTTKILVELDHFVPDYTTGVGYFNVDSYPIDDANTSNTSAIVTAEIPFYESSTQGSFNLRNSVDLRPFKVSTASSVNTTDPANTQITINPTSNNNFSVYSNGQYMPQVDENLTFDFEFYLPRNDIVTINKEGDIVVKEGSPSLNPIVPFNESDTSVLIEARLKPFPSLTDQEALQYNRNDLKTRTVSRTNKRYTMKDIGTLEKRIRVLEYYTVLNALEQQAKDLVIPSASDPTLNRFKNGIFADPFNSHLLGKVSDFEYNIAIDPREKVIRPKIKKFSVDFRYNHDKSTNTNQYFESVTIPFYEQRFVYQQKITKSRNVSKSSWQWNGNLQLFPNRDYFVDETSNVNTVEIDFAQPWEEFANSPFGSVYGEWRTVDTTSSVNSGTNVESNASREVITTTTTTTTNTTQQQSVEGINLDIVNNTYDFGNYVSNINFQPYIRTQLVAFIATDMRPNSKVYAFFDDVNVTQHCAPGISNPNVGSYSQTRDHTVVIQGPGDFGSELFTDNDGRVVGLFRIPSESFRIGDRTFMLVNVDNIETGQDSILTSSRAIFSSQNVSVTRTQNVLSTREPKLLYTSDLNTRTITDTNVSTDTTVINITTRPPPPTPAPTTQPPPTSAPTTAAPTTTTTTTAAPTTTTTTTAAPTTTTTPAPTTPAPTTPAPTTPAPTTPAPTTPAPTTPAPTTPAPTTPAPTTPAPTTPAPTTPAPTTPAPTPPPPPPPPTPAPTTPAPTTPAPEPCQEAYAFGCDGTTGVHTVGHMGSGCIAIHGWTNDVRSWREPNHPQCVPVCIPYPQVFKGCTDEPNPDGSITRYGTTRASDTCGNIFDGIDYNHPSCPDIPAPPPTTTPPPVIQRDGEGVGAYRNNAGDIYYGDNPPQGYDNFSPGWANPTI